MSSLYNFAAASDAPWKTATFEARSPEEQARDLGGAVLQAFRRDGKLLNLDSTAKCLLYALCFEHGRVEDMGEGMLGLVIRKPMKEISVEMGWLETSAYRPTQRLEADGFLKEMPSIPGRIKHYFLTPTFAPKMESPEDVAAAQAARSKRAMSQIDHSAPDRNSLTDHEKARAGCVLSQIDHSLTPVDVTTKSAIPANGPDAAQGARSGCDSSTVRTLTSTFTSTAKMEGGGGENAAVKEGIEWVLPWLLKFGVKANAAGRLAGNPMLTPEIALAARIELENSSASKKANFRPAGLIIRILSNPQVQIGEKSWDAAKLALGTKPAAAPAFAPSRIQDLFREVLPAASPASAIAAAAPPAPVAPTRPLLDESMSDEARATQIQQTISQAELAALHKQAIAEATSDFTRMSTAKSNPRTSYAIHALILKRLTVTAGASA